MNTWRFITERFPLKATLPLTAILAFGPMSSAPFTIADGVTIFTTLFLTLLAVRMADDLASIDTDRITHPDRGLPSGRINATRLTYAMVAAAMVVVVLNLFGGHFRDILFLVGYYGLYFITVYCRHPVESILFRTPDARFVCIWLGNSARIRAQRTRRR